MSEDSIIERKFGRKVPFKVPRGYFERLEKTVTQNIAEAAAAPKAAVRRRLRPLRWAACIAAIAIGAAIYLGGGGGAAGERGVAAAAESGAERRHYGYTTEEVSDFAMLDNDDLYSYLSSE